MSLLSLCTTVQCANEATGHTITQMLADQGPLKSDCDEQLLMTFVFPQDKAVNVEEIAFSAPCGNAAPRTVSVYVNTGPMQFETIERLKPDDTVTLAWVPSKEKPDTMVAKAQLPHVMRRAAIQLTVFVVDNITDGDDDVTVLSGMDIRGRPSTTTGAFQAPPKKC